MNKIRQFLLLDFFGKLNFLALFGARLKTRLFYRYFFGSVGQGSAIFKPLLVSNPRRIFVGQKVLIRDGARLEVVQVPGGDARLLIGDNVNIEQNVHVVCGSNISIGNNVTITGQVAIVDIVHPYEDIENDIKIGARIDCIGNYVAIGDGAFIGFGAVILPNVKIGAHAVVGSLSVVTRDVPDYSVVAGNPAKVIKKFCFETNKWMKIL